jgi:hypothetical protein
MLALRSPSGAICSILTILFFLFRVLRLDAELSKSTQYWWCIGNVAWARSGRPNACAKCAVACVFTRGCSGGGGMYGRWVG